MVLLLVLRFSDEWVVVDKWLSWSGSAGEPGAGEVPAVLFSVAGQNPYLYVKLL